MPSRLAVMPLALLLVLLPAACSLETAATAPPGASGVGGVDHIPGTPAAVADAGAVVGDEDAETAPPPPALVDDALFALRALPDQPQPEVVRIARSTGNVAVLFRGGPEASSGASIAVDDTSVYVPTITRATPSHLQHAILVLDRVTGDEVDRFAMPSPILALHRSHEGELYVVFHGDEGLIVHRLSITERRLAPPVAIGERWSDDSVIAGDILVISNGIELKSFDLNDGQMTHRDGLAFAGTLTGSTDGRVVDLSEGFDETELFVVDARTGDADMQATLPDGLATEGFIEGQTLWLIVRSGAERVLVAYDMRSSRLTSRAALSASGGYGSLRGSIL